MILPPGTILQNMYFKERLRQITPGRFIEIGVGQGHLSKILLDLGWSGTGYELNPESARKALETNRAAVREGRYEVEKADWLKSRRKQKADLIVSSMVLEHLSEGGEEKYFRQSARALKKGGVIAFFVPSCPRYWGIEDEIAGHYRRYTFEEMERRADKFGWKLREIAGLTFPLSNWLYPLSERLVAKAEGKNKKLKMIQRTKLSGNRNVLFKTTYPWFLGLVLNPLVLYPFHLLQKWNARNSLSMVIYAEMEALS